MKWDDLRIFLAVSKAASLSDAARALGVNQSTVSRRLAGMERQLGTQLVVRAAEGHLLTAAGEELSAHAARIGDAFTRIERRLSGRDADLSGELRVTCVDMLAGRRLAPHLARFAALNPRIALRVLTPMRPLDLIRREADVAIRVSEAPPDPLVGRRLFGFALAVYASPDYLSRLGRVPAPGALDWVGWDDEDANTRMIHRHFPDARLRHRVDSFPVLRALLRAGAGVSVLPCYWADADAGLRRVYPDPVPAGTRGLWVLAHPDLRRAPRVQAFTRFIAEALLPDRALFEGRQAGAA